jgi:COMPASS component SWD3
MLRQGLTTKTLRGHTREVFCLNYNPMSTLLVSGGCDGDMRIWNPAKGFAFVLHALHDAHAKR